MEIETDSKSDALSVSWRNRIAPQLRWVRQLSVRTETPEGGVVVRVGGHFGVKSPHTNTLNFCKHYLEMCPTNRSRTKRTEAFNRGDLRMTPAMYGEQR